MFVAEREASVPSGILLQDLNHVAKVEVEVRVGLVCTVGVDHWGREE